MGREATATGALKRWFGWVMIVSSFGVASVAARVSSHQLDPNVQLRYGIVGLSIFAAMLLAGTLLVRSANRDRAVKDADLRRWRP
jgi:hypothetical protein